MRTALLAPVALAASALALPSQLTFAPAPAPAPAAAESIAREALVNPLRDAWKSVIGSEPVGWVADGVRKFSHQVVADGVDCASPLLCPLLATVGPRIHPAGLARHLSPFAVRHY